MLALRDRAADDDDDDEEEEDDDEEEEEEEKGWHTTVQSSSSVSKSSFASVSSSDSDRISENLLLAFYSTSVTTSRYGGGIQSQTGPKFDRFHPLNISEILSASRC